MAERPPWLVVGLGNPGAKYAQHRHNAGFMVVDAFADEFATPGTGWRAKWSSETMSVTGPFRRAVLLKPQEYMNCSGPPVVRAAAFHHVPPARTVVVHDEVDFAFGRVAIKNGGGHGGHNGLRDIISQWGTPDFIRVRVGVGRPERGDVSHWLLSDFSGEDAAEVPDLLRTAKQALTAVLVDGVRAAMNDFNRASSTGKEDSSG